MDLFSVFLAYQPTWVCFLGVFFALPPYDEDEDEQKDENEAHESNNHQKPPFLIKGGDLLGW